jgi:glutathione S-transferase
MVIETEGVSEATAAQVAAIHETIRAHQNEAEQWRKEAIAAFLALCKANEQRKKDRYIIAGSLIFAVIFTLVNVALWCWSRMP